MSRLIVFSLIMVSIVTVLTLKNYKSYPISNERFDMVKTKEQHDAHLKELAELVARQHPVKKAEVVEKVEAPLVVLDTEQLKNGSKLYKKCMVCHGKSGGGKKSQNAPRIAGQFSSYIEQQINAMKSGTRINQKMIPYIKKLSPEEIKDLAAYISKMPWRK